MLCHKRRNLFLINVQFQIYNDRVLLKIFLLHITLDQIAFYFRTRHCIFNSLRISPGHTEFFRTGHCLGAIDIQCYLLVQLGVNVFLHNLFRFRTGHTFKADLAHIYTGRNCFLCTRGNRGREDQTSRHDRSHADNPRILFHNYLLKTLTLMENGH